MDLQTQIEGLRELQATEEAKLDESEKDLEGLQELICAEQIKNSRLSNQIQLKLGDILAKTSKDRIFDSIGTVCDAMCADLAEQKQYSMVHDKNGYYGYLDAKKVELEKTLEKRQKDFDALCTKRTALQERNNRMREEFYQQIAEMENEILRLRIKRVELVHGKGP